MVRKTNKAVKGISKAYSYRKNLSGSLLGFGNAFGGNTKSQKQGTRPVGRPAGPASYKHRSPFNNQPIPATEYYKQMRLARRLRQQRESQIQQNTPRQYPQRVITSQQGQPIQQVQQKEEQQLTKEQLTQMEVQRQIQNQQSTAVRPIWRRRPVIGQEAGQTKVYGIPQSFWN